MSLGIQRRIQFQQGIQIGTMLTQRGVLNIHSSDGGILNITAQVYSQL